MEETKNKPTIEDVAKRCGVSVSTVSRVINRSTPVSTDLNLRVRKAIKELGFTPRQWKDRTIARTVVLVIPDILNPYYGEIIHGAQEEADKQGLRMVVMYISEDPALQRKHLSLLSQWMFDGLIVTGTRLSSKFLVKLHEDYRMPIVVSRSKETEAFPCVIPDMKAAIYQSTKYLISLHHERIAFLSGPPEWNSSRIRVEAITRALGEASLSMDANLHRHCLPTVEAGFQTGRNLMALPDNTRPTAILAFNDLVAVGVLRAIHSIGLRVPRDVSVIGADDLDLAAYTIPSLTTISQPTFRLGQVSMQKIVDLLQGNLTFAPEITFLECPLILRESTAPCTL
ncbi:hypothetical protein CSA56_18620 [candidate division KSB3 bacterium]|uniref:HTH lacI-type domain-containing protein n=1 Tax=candidate division KSB3 bacterium TaxID=2044937 RepID=A0A2G6K965_9BACT|nr:MAG: hypothetical protein CSA56_18620 [candidate division KSB3 bacterium]